MIRCTSAQLESVQEQIFQYFNLGLKVGDIN